jgi:hypothetical protein
MTFNNSLVSVTDSEVRSERTLLLLLELYFWFNVFVSCQPITAFLKGFSSLFTSLLGQTVLSVHCPSRML